MGMLLKTNAVNFKLKTFPFVIQAWVLECLPQSVSSILARNVDNGYPRMVLFGDLTPEAEELEIEYYKRTLTWVKQISVSHEIPAASVPEPIDEDNIPGFLTSTLAFIKIEKKLEVGFKKIETMLDYLETRVANVEHSMSNGKSRWRPMPCVW
ncbi:hypothetical protein LIER_32373 [Lithospermum erythrorhizon]|uniref:Uncharacterized protein n=1 Tax=Lithospermum erythrorhizon TaxID=34254 RepID=A0AAV3RWS2_LITER